VFVGVYERQLDERGRVALPSSFRGDLGDRCYLFFGDDGCVSVRSESAFESQALELIEQVKSGEASRARQRAFSSSAVNATIDRQGRITLEPRLREHAGIEVHRPVTVLGSLDHIEIWDPEKFAATEAIGQSEIAGGDS
jgi:MraZ protein